MSESALKRENNDIFKQKYSPKQFYVLKCPILFVIA